MQTQHKLTSVYVPKAVRRYRWNWEKCLPLVAVMWLASCVTLAMFTMYLVYVFYWYVR